MTAISILLTVLAGLLLAAVLAALFLPTIDHEED